MTEETMPMRDAPLPELSASAKKMDMQRLLSAPLPTYESSVPGSWWWTNVAFWLCRRVSAAQFRTTESSSETPLQRDGGGAMCCGWHTNGLMDPLGIFLQHPKEFVVGARHDLVTRPMLSWWTRRLAVQPVVRKAELLRGGCTEAEAAHLNGRSLLALSSGVAHGFGCVLFPEGTSHSDSHMMRFKTGPMRTVLAASALAIARGLPLPELVPVGLHFRHRERFRTNQYIEFGEPICIQPNDVPAELVEAVKHGDWVEPPSEAVNALRDRLRDRLPHYTPDTSTWTEHRALHVIAHVRANRSNAPLSSWKEEVHAAREVRTGMEGRSNTAPPSPLTGPTMEAAREVATVLEDAGLDGRDLNPAATGLRKARLAAFPGALLKLSLFLALLPLTVTAFGFQIALGRLLGDSTDEGLDARTSYQFLAAFFGSLLVWPVVAAGWVALAVHQSDVIAAQTGWDWLQLFGGQQSDQLWVISGLYLLCFPVFWLCGMSFAWGWDAWVDLRKAWVRRRVQRQTAERLSALLERC
jgi:1-acyl-sn-glycerol-3-phosphate acyltransferase